MTWMRKLRKRSGHRSLRFLDAFVLRLSFRRATVVTKDRMHGNEELRRAGSLLAGSTSSTAAASRATPRSATTSHCRSVPSPERRRRRAPLRRSGSGTADPLSFRLIDDRVFMPLQMSVVVDGEARIRLATEADLPVLFGYGRIDNIDNPLMRPRTHTAATAVAWSCLRSARPPKPPGTSGAVGLMTTRRSPSSMPTGTPRLSPSSTASSTSERRNRSGSRTATVYRRSWGRSVGSSLYWADDILFVGIPRKGARAARSLRQASRGRRLHEKAVLPGRPPRRRDGLRLGLRRTEGRRHD